MDIKAQARFVRISPRKARLVIGLIRNMDVIRAVEQLEVLPKKAGHIVLKLLQSAIANAKHNNQIEASTLKVSQAFVDGGPTLKRWRPRAFGRAAAIRKRTSHITIVLSEKGDAKGVASKKEAVAAQEKISKSQVPNSKQEPKSKTPKKKPVAKKPEDKK